jgi:hypothetical protein
MPYPSHAYCVVFEWLPGAGHNYLGFQKLMLARIPKVCDIDKITARLTQQRCGSVQISPMQQHTLDLVVGSIRASPQVRDGNV